MSLKPGTQLGPYELEALIGAGGMGEVFRVKDTRLERTVAVKVPDELSRKPGLRQRFEREARAIASLNHPNICALHDVGQQDGWATSRRPGVNGMAVSRRPALVSGFCTT